MDKFMQINNARGIGFLMFYDIESEDPENKVTYSYENALKYIYKIPLYHYIVIDNPNSDEHGTMYQKVIDTESSTNDNIQYKLDKIYQLASVQGNEITTERIKIIQEEELSEPINERLYDYLDKLLKFFEAY